MTREEAKLEIRRRWREIIPTITTPARMKVRGETSWICPVCGHGTHGDGLCANPRSASDGLKCFGCGWAGNVIDLYQQTTGKSFPESITFLADQLGIRIDGKSSGTGSDRETPEKDAGTAQRAKYGSKEADYTEYYRECFGRLNDPRAKAYLEKRGISQATAEANLLGFDPEADPGSAPGALESDHAEKKHPEPRIIIPTSMGHYVARRLENRGDKYDKMNPVGRDVTIFGEASLYKQDAQEVFVAEGVFDALSIIEVGAAAVGLNSAVNADLLLRALKDRPTTATLILCLDNDENGQKARQKLEKGLPDLNVDFIVADVCGDVKDPNDALTGNREQFTERVQEAITAARTHRENKLTEKQEAQKVKIQEYYKKSAAAYLPAFEEEIRKRANTPAISTGFYSLDQILDGGLYDGLYIMGAISSLGKTTFALQLMDNIAQAGNDVLIFSLEMARFELMAKSISRHTFLLSDGKTKDAKTTRGILAGSRYDHYNQNERDLIRMAKEEYKKYAGRIVIEEGVGNVDIKRVKSIVKQHIESTGRRPVVLIDYLQLLAPADPHYSDKQNTDRAVLELKRMSRDYDIPVVAISSFNRNSYTDPVNMAAFKESGAIEYSSDVLIGLQYEGMDYQEGEAEKTREKRIRDLLKEMENVARDGETQRIQVKILKNRNGIRGSVHFTYRPIFNYFSDGNSADGFEVMDDVEQGSLPFDWQK